MAFDSATDLDIVTAARAGTLPAFEALVERYQGLVCAVAYSSTGDRAMSEDVAQDTFLAAWKGLAGLREDSAVRGWLCGIARNLAHNALRKAGREPIDDAAIDADVIDDEPSPLDAAIDKESEALVWSALSRIPSTYREPLVLFYRQAQSIPEVATGLGISEEAARQRLARGRKQLKATVESMVERTLGNTRPGRAFTLAVMAAIVALGAGTASAGTASAAASSPDAAPASSPATPSASWRAPHWIAAGAVALLAVIAVLAVRGSGDGSHRSHATQPATAVDSDPGESDEAATHIARRTGADAPDAVIPADRFDAELDPARPTVVIEVLDLLGGPVPGAVIRSDDTERAVTDSDGLARVTMSLAQADALQRFAIEADGYARDAITTAGYGQFTVRLVPESAIAGVVVQRGTRTPVPGITVTAYGMTAVTDAKGRFAIASLPPGELTVTASGPGWRGALPAPIDLGLHAQQHDLVVPVSRAAQVSGVVVGTGLPNPTRITASQEGAFPPSSDHFDAAVAADGSFRFDALPAGTWQLRLSSAFVAGSLSVEVGNRDVTGVRFDVGALVPVRVRVVDASGAPVAEMNVGGTQERDGSLSSVGCRTDDAGQCDIVAVAPGVLDRLAPHGFESMRRQVTVEDGATARYQLPPLAGISGRIVAADGTPWPYRIVTIQSADAPRQGATVIADASGRFAFAGLPPGKHTVRASRYGMRSFSSHLTSRNEPPAGERAITLAAGEQRADVIVHANIERDSIRGTVVTADGAPARDAVVSCVVDSPRVTRGAFPATGVAVTITDAAGQFELPAIAHGKYKLYAQTPTGDRTMIATVHPTNQAILLTTVPPQ